MKLLLWDSDGFLTLGKRFQNDRGFRLSEPPTGRYNR
ncbi:hypothetical protein [Singulisphaera sp. Ch08]